MARNLDLTHDLYLTVDGQRDLRPVRMTGLYTRGTFDEGSTVEFLKVFEVHGDGTEEDITNRMDGRSYDSVVRHMLSVVEYGP